ncbi:hypothetical protein [Pseudomonas syringae]|uniref:hypothetical protein n=1 Tax=Pseudomonas syringae TaxID=317 RepID=UPI001F1BE94B|nr:hypothetical protein [Pseudomonas syringae]
MSGSWLNNVARETEKPRLQGGFFCKRRLTRHDWNDGNNNLAEVLLNEVHELEGRAVQAGKSSAAVDIELHNRPESAEDIFVCLMGINIFVSHWHFNVDLAVSYSSFDYQAH